MIFHLRSYSFIPHEGTFEVRRISEEEFVKTLSKGGIIKAGIRHRETFRYVKNLLGLKYIKNSFDNINLLNKNEILYAIRKEGDDRFVIWEIKSK